MQRKNPDSPTPPAARPSGERPRNEPAGERIAKAIARAGLCSRREAEAWIASGRVAVNGAIIASPALTVTAQDRIEVDGKPLPERERTRLFLYYKPAGLVTTTADPEGRPTIFTALPKDLPRLISVGRLDINTEGLLPLTNDGGLARMLELPATGWLRRYRVRAHGHVDQAALDRLRDGITVHGVRYGPIEATLDREQGANVWLTMAIREGKNREIRNVVEALGLQANRLIRISFGPFQLGELREGDVVEVRTRVLREQLGERIAAEAACDFSAPIIQREPDETRAPAPPRAGHRERARTAEHGGHKRPARRDEPSDRRDHEHARPRGRLRRANRTEPESTEKPPGRPRRGHAWRAEDAPLSRHYRGAGSKAHRAESEGDGPKRAGLVADRKGRRVLVERFGAAAKASEERRHGREHKISRGTRLPDPPRQEGSEQSARKPESPRRDKAERHGGDPQRRDDRTPFRRDERKPRRGRPEPRDRPRGAGPRPSRPRPR